MVNPLFLVVAIQRQVRAFSLEGRSSKPLHSNNHDEEEFFEFFFCFKSQVYCFLLGLPGLSRPAYTESVLYALINRSLNP